MVREPVEAVMVFYTIYDRPRDYPQEFVVRCHRILRGSPEPVADSDLFARGMTVDYVRSTLPAGLNRIGPWPGDDPCILEVWC